VLAICRAGAARSGRSVRRRRHLRRAQRRRSAGVNLARR